MVTFLIKIKSHLLQERVKRHVPCIDQEIDPGLARPPREAVCNDCVWNLESVQFALKSLQLFGGRIDAARLVDRDVYPGGPEKLGE